MRPTWFRSRTARPFRGLLCTEVRPRACTRNPRECGERKTGLIGETIWKGARSRALISPTCGMPDVRLPERIPSVPIRRPDWDRCVKQTRQAAESLERVWRGQACYLSCIPRSGTKGDFPTSRRYITPSVMDAGVPRFDIYDTVICSRHAHSRVSALPVNILVIDPVDHRFTTDRTKAPIKKIGK